MPELPEVQTVVSGLKPWVENKIITQVIVRQPKLRWRVCENLAEKITGNKILTVTRRSKYIIFELQRGYLIWHLGMSGSFNFAISESVWQKHEHIGLTLNNSMQLRYLDPRRFGFLLWTDKNPLKHKLLVNLAPEPLSADFNADYLSPLLKGKRQAIKNFIMDLRKVVGVGNIYANEVLFLAGILPTRQAGELSEREISNLVTQIKTVLNKAILAGGTTLKDFKNIEGKAGYFSQQLQVYGRVGQSCNICKTPIVGVKIGQRSSFYCPKCQK